MSEVERRFLEKLCKVKNTPNPKMYLERLQKLKALRQASQIKLKQDGPTQNILIDFTQSISRFLEQVLKNGYPLFGKPLCDKTLIGHGSLARKEMSPYSDLELALLIEKSSHRTPEYFRKTDQWLELQVINLGETAIKILDQP